MEFGFLVKPYLEFQPNPCQISALQEPAAAQENINLELRLPPSSGDVDDAVGAGGENGFKTPTSPGRMIPTALKCPPAPRKPKSAPSVGRRKAILEQRILLDLSKEIESLFPPELLADLGNKIKKARQGK